MAGLRVQPVKRPQSVAEFAELFPSREADNTAAWDIDPAPDNRLPPLTSSRPAVDESRATGGMPADAIRTHYLPKQGDETILPPAIAEPTDLPRPLTPSDTKAATEGGKPPETAPRERLTPQKARDAVKRLLQADPDRRFWLRFGIVAALTLALVVLLLLQLR